MRFLKMLAPILPDNVFEMLAAPMKEAMSKMELQPGEMNPFIALSSDGKKMTSSIMVLKKMVITPEMVGTTIVAFSRTDNSSELSKDSLKQLEQTNSEQLPETNT